MLRLVLLFLALVIASPALSVWDRSPLSSVNDSVDELSGVGAQAPLQITPEATQLVVWWKRSKLGTSEVNQLVLHQCVTQIIDGNCSIWRNASFEDLNGFAQVWDPALGTFLIPELTVAGPEAGHIRVVANRAGSNANTVGATHDARWSTGGSGGGSPGGPVGSATAWDYDLDLEDSTGWPHSECPGGVCSTAAEALQTALNSFYYLGSAARVANPDKRLWLIRAAGRVDVSAIQTGLANPMLRVVYAPGGSGEKDSRFQAFSIHAPTNTGIAANGAPIIDGTNLDGSTHGVLVFHREIDLHVTACTGDCDYQADDLSDNLVAQVLGGERWGGFNGGKLTGATYFSGSLKIVNDEQIGGTGPGLRWTTSRPFSLARENGFAGGCSNNFDYCDPTDSNVCGGAGTCEPIATIGASYEQGAYRHTEDGMLIADLNRNHPTYAKVHSDSWGGKFNRVLVQSAGMGIMLVGNVGMRGNLQCSGGIGGASVQVGDPIYGSRVMYAPDCANGSCNPIDRGTVSKAFITGTFECTNGTPIAYFAGNDGGMIEGVGEMGGFPDAGCIATLGAGFCSQQGGLGGADYKTCHSDDYCDSITPGSSCEFRYPLTSFWGSTTLEGNWSSDRRKAAFETIAPICIARGSSKATVDSRLFVRGKLGPNREWGRCADTGRLCKPSNAATDCPASTCQSPGECGPGECSQGVERFDGADMSVDLSQAVTTDGEHVEPGIKLFSESSVGGHTITEEELEVFYNITEPYHPNRLERRKAYVSCEAGGFLPIGSGSGTGAADDPFRDLSEVQAFIDADPCDYEIIFDTDNCAGARNDVNLEVRPECGTRNRTGRLSRRMLCMDTDPDTAPNCTIDRNGATRPAGQPSIHIISPGIDTTYDSGWDSVENIGLINLDQGTGDGYDTTGHGTQLVVMGARPTGCGTGPGDQVYSPHGSANAVETDMPSRMILLNSSATVANGMIYQPGTGLVETLVLSDKTWEQTGDGAAVFINHLNPNANTAFGGEHIFVGPTFRGTQGSPQAIHFRARKSNQLSGPARYSFYEMEIDNFVRGSWVLSSTDTSNYGIFDEFKVSYKNVNYWAYQDSNVVSGTDWTHEAQCILIGDSTNKRKLFQDAGNNYVYRYRNSIFPLASNGWLIAGAFQPSVQSIFDNTTLDAVGEFFLDTRGTTAGPPYTRPQITIETNVDQTGAGINCLDESKECWSACRIAKRRALPFILPDFLDGNPYQLLELNGRGRGHIGKGAPPDPS